MRTKVFIVGALISFLTAHAFLGQYLKPVRPELGILPPLPSKNTVAGLSLGDDQFLYRSFVLQIQNAGDSGGHYTAMRDYDISAVLRWMGVLQSLDVQSIHYMFLLVRYFAIGANNDDLEKIVHFIDQDVQLAPARKWYWQTQAVMIANSRLKNPELALKLSRPLKEFWPYLPSGFMWVLQMEPVLLADVGRFAEARAKMDDILTQHSDRMTASEQSWTRDFLQRLQKKETHP